MSSADCGGVIRGTIRPLGEVYLLFVVETCIKGLFSLFARKLAYGGTSTQSAAGIYTKDSSGLFC